MSTPVSTRSGTSGTAWMPSVRFTVLKSFGPVSRSQVVSLAGRGAARGRVGTRGGCSAAAEATRRSAARGILVTMVAAARELAEHSQIAQSSSGNYTSRRTSMFKTVEI